MVEKDEWFDQSFLTDGTSLLKKNLIFLND